MLKKYDCRKRKIERVIDSMDLDRNEIEARTRAFIQICKFNHSNPSKMSRKLLNARNMAWMANCEMIIDDTVLCTGVSDAIGPYSYIWKDEYFEVMNDCRKIYWKELSKNDK